MRINWFIQASVVIVVVVLSMTGVAISAGPPVHSVVGSGRVLEGGVTFWTSIAAFQDANGGVWGAAVIQIDLSTFGLGQVGLQNAVNCVDVDGNSAWVGGVVTHSTNPDIIPPGVVTITLVRDLGGEGQDIMHGELFPPGSVCTDRPALPETVVNSGNFKVW